MGSEALTKLITYDDYRELPDDGKQYQIIGGELYMAPAPRIYHQRILLNLAKIVDTFTDKNNLGDVLIAPVDVVLSMTDVVQPDLIFVSKKRLNIVTKNNIVAAPDLVVEILSEHSETIDRTKKKDLYERHGVKEYWIVDPENKKIEQFILTDQKFAEQPIVHSDKKLSSSVLKGLNLNLDKVFD